MWVLRRHQLRITHLALALASDSLHACYGSDASLILFHQPTPVSAAKTAHSRPPTGAAPSSSSLQRSRSDVDVNAAATATARTRMPAVPSVSAALPFSSASALPPGSYASLGERKTPSPVPPSPSPLPSPDFPTPSDTLTCEIEAPRPDKIGMLRVRRVRTPYTAAIVAKKKR